MKKIQKLPIFLGMILVVAIMNFGYSQTQPISSTSVAVDNVLSMYNLVVSPNPVISGSNITVSFQLFNSYPQELTNINIGLTTESEILNVSPSNSNLVEAMGPGFYGYNGFDQFNYKLHIPSTLNSGLYTVDVLASYETTQPNGLGSGDIYGESEMPITFYVYGKPKLSFSIMPQSQITPGSSFNFELDIVNTGTGTANNISIELNSSKNSSIIGQNMFDIGTMAPGASDIIDSEAHINRNASSISFGIHSFYQGLKLYNQSANIPLKVFIGNPDLVINVVNAEPPQLYSGFNQTVSLLIQNVGSGTAKNISINYENSNSITIQSSARNFFIGSLPPGSTATESLFISANSSTENYIFANMTYLNANYQNKSVSIEKIPIGISKTALFNITRVNDSLSPGGAYQPLYLKIKNIGNEPAQQITLSIQTIYPISPIAGTAYVNYLAPNQTANVTFYVSTDTNGAAGSYPITLYEQWKQPNTPSQNIFSGSNSYYAVVYSSVNSAINLSAYGIDISILVIIIILAAALRIIIKIHKKPKDTKKRK